MLSQFITIMLIINQILGGPVNQKCKDLHDQSEHEIGSIWRGKTGCFVYECKEIKVQAARNLEFAVPIKKLCAPIAPDPLCTLLPESDGEFPSCCPLKVCIHDNGIEVVLSDNGNATQKAKTVKKAIESATIETKSVEPVRVN